MRAVQRYERFSATRHHAPDGEDTLHVRGTVVLRSGGWTCTLRPPRGSLGVDRRVLTLDLVFGGPPGDGAPQALTPCPIELSLADASPEYERVDFRVVGTEDDPPPALRVTAAE